MSQHDLFNPPKFTRTGHSIVPPTREEVARQLRDDGIRRAAHHANVMTPQWTDAALAYFERYARAHITFTTEAVRVFAEAEGLPPAPDARAWGSIALRAAKAGTVSKDGYTTAEDPRGHKRPSTLWRSNTHKVA